MISNSVLIIGGGVVGSACAYELTKRGVKVTIIDKGRIGYGCSYGNAGWITPSTALPLPMPGSLIRSTKWLLDPESPLYIKPRPSWSLLCWLAKFAAHTTQAHLVRAAAALTEMANKSQTFYESFVASRSAELDFSKPGLLEICSNEADLRQALKIKQLLEDLGMSAQQLSGQQLRELEPGLIGPVHGGILYPDDSSVEPLRMVEALCDAAQEAGATVLSDTQVIAFECAGRRIQSVATTRGPIEVDQVLLAAGTWSAPLAKSLHLPVPIESGKGYAVIVDPIDPMPRHMLHLVSAHLAVTSRSDSLRLAGTMELAGLDESITVRRVEAVIRGAQHMLNIPRQPKITEIWGGLRPCTPDGLPIIGRPPRYDNLILAAGHAMLGLTMAPATAELVADLFTGQTPQVNPQPFSPARF